ncbi:hypothetical protein PPTG_15400 [Plasmopara halstedii]|uniref:Transmembrane protein n=1 Tax=Plasmopara halstedii TaxID=4781 RepID=A0A0P1AYU6_PLAHL|nr:hypothetical protein PPTG_15400 [Plasmopara halstedii]CEG47473.1 hypothetical protein PPTG_15400 [Plasmopara halstedii]|eukprot:XP_024583842.1 hypothetical protein PPTG_15400 [Plasmopara halstedii]
MSSPLSSWKQDVPFLNVNEAQEFPIRKRSLDASTSIDRGRRRRRRRDTSVLGPDSLSSVDFRSRSDSAPPDVEDAAARKRSHCKGRHTLFEDLTRLADKKEPVHFDTFRQGAVQRHNKINEAFHSDMNDANTYDEDIPASEKLNTELLEAYLAYCKSIGHEPNIKIGDEYIPSGTNNLSANGDKGCEQPRVVEKQHCWTACFGARYSRRRGCVQFWAWLGIGVGVVIWLGFSLSGLHLNEVLHLDAFTQKNVRITQDYTYLHFPDEVDFHLTYTVETVHSDSLTVGASLNSSNFNVLLLSEDEYEHYVRGEPFEYVNEGSTLRTTFAYMPRTYIENKIGESMYFVIQPCYLSRDPTHDYCQLPQLPSAVNSDVKIYYLNNVGKMSEHEAWEQFNVSFISVDPEPVACRSSGIVGSAYLLLFLPYVIITLFGLRVFQMITHCESFQTNIERMYARELKVPENEVDYWQPMPWDRKVPKTRLCGPCCWNKFRRPFEPFYTWWRHENYFTWILYPYRNEQLSRGERALIVVCSLYITFYVLFIIVMLRDSWGSDMTIFTSVGLYAILVAVMPSAGKAIFKELFKLIFRQRRKYFRAKAAGGELNGISFRLAFLLQVLVAFLLTLAQGPIFYIWAFRSCLFLTRFIYYGVLAAIARMSLMGLAQDFAWYLIIKTWGWKDLCPYCTERIKHCDCFNDELLVLAVQHVGPKWDLIRDLDGLLARQKQYEPQFALYTSEQLRERWNVIVKRAEKHMEKVEKLRVYRAKKHQDELRRNRIRRSVTSFMAFTGSEDKRLAHDNDSNSGEHEYEGVELDDGLCHFREKKILALDSKIQLDEFEKHYDSNIADVFHALTRSVMKRRRHDKQEHVEESDESELEDKHSLGTSITTRQSSDSSSEGETMWVLVSPSQRLERREEEKLQRIRAFRVLNDYNIKKVGISMEKALSISDRDTRRVPLISTQSQETTQVQEDLVILMPDVHKKSDNIAKEHLEGVANAGEDDKHSDQLESNYFPSDLERGQSNSAVSYQSESASRVYAVTERRKSLLRRLTTSAEAFAAWALDYDLKAAQEL